MTVVDGWISIDEMEFVASQMRNIGKTGTILEIGAAAGRLFSFLQPKFPDWTYVAVDPWEQEQVRLQIDWNKGYFDDNNLGEVITKDMFSKIVHLQKCTKHILKTGMMNVNLILLVWAL